MNSPLHDTNIDEVLSFWLGEAAVDAPTLLAKFQRWYAGGAGLDAKLRQRFGSLVEKALVGELDPWRLTLRGRLALIVVLDQFTRNVFRDSPRAYAGDSAARTLALDVIEDGTYRACQLEQRLFLIMPLVHAEDLNLQTLAVKLALEMVGDAPPPLKAAWSLGRERTEHYRSIIARVGRFPHRNAILGRTSTPAELEILAEEARRAPPLPPLPASQPEAFSRSNARSSTVS